MLRNFSMTAELCGNCSESVLWVSDDAAGGLEEPEDVVSWPGCLNSPKFSDFLWGCRFQEMV